jgi:hypothetical protein
MTLGIALLLIFILYLIDKHNRWRIAAKLTGGLIVLCILAVGGFFGWEKYQAWRGARQEARQEAEYEAEQAKQAAQKVAELAKTCKNWEDNHPIGSPPDKLYTEQGGLTEKLTNKHYWVLGAPQGCEGPLELDYTSRNVWIVVPPHPTQPKLKMETQPQSQPNCQAVVCSGWAVVSPEYGSRIASRNCFDADLTSRVLCGNIAVLKKGDRVQILSDKVRAPDGSDIYEAKFQQWTGWVSASDLGSENGEEKSLPRKGPDEAGQVRRETHPDASTFDAYQVLGPHSSSAFGVVYVSSDPNAAGIYVDDSFVAKAPATLNLKPGQHYVRAFLNDYKNWSRQITITAGSEAKLTITLEKSN